MRPVVSSFFRHSCHWLFTPHIRRAFATLSLLSLVWIVSSLLFPSTVQGLSAGIVISQVYGGGGNSGAPYTNDFIEVFNRGMAAVNVNGWSVQYASATSASWSKTNLPNVTIPPGGYLLVQEASGGANGVALPTADAAGTLSMATSGGKVALVNDTTTLSGTCPVGANIVDLVGYSSSANCFETATAAVHSNTTAILRQSNGCTETDNNATDFTVGTPNPRNSASPVNSCGGPTNPTGTGAASPNTVTPGGTTLLTVTVTPGTNPASTGLSVSGDLTSIGGAASQTFFDNGTNGDVTASDNIFSYQATVSGSTTTGAKTLNINIADAQARTGSTTISLMVQPPIVPGSVVISQVYGGGGNSGAPYTNDFIEVFNRGLVAVNLNGWSVQYAGATSASWSKTNLPNVTIPPGGYLLIQEASGGANGVALPTADATGTSAMATSGGKIALVTDTITLSIACPAGANIVDLVGYGSSANCFETATAAAHSNTSVTLRQANGCTETDNNAADFATGAPNPRNSVSPTFSCFTAPNVTAHPGDQLVAPGASASFTAAAAGTAPISVQWQVSTDGGATWGNVAGATNTTLTLPVVALTDNGKRFRAQFINALGNANSNSALLTVLPAEAKILDPLVCIGDGTTLQVRAEIKNTSNLAIDGVFRAQLGANLVTRNSSCVITGNGSCSFTSNDRVRWGGTLQPAERVVIEYQVQVLPGVVTGTDLCITSTFELNAGPIATVQACTKVNCPLIPTGGAPPTGIAANGHTPGSVLFFNYYTSDVARPQLENTRLNITNTDGARGVVLHMFFVSSDDCRVADTFLCLTANQTTSLLASDYDPGMQGFLVVVAVDGQSGCPINFNYLIGSEFIKLSSGHATSLGAIAIAAIPRGPMACDPTDTTARLDFDGTDYNLVPRVLAVNNIQSPLDGNSTLLILNRIGGDFSTGTATRLGDLLGLVYDDKERGYSFGFDPSGCQYAQRIFDGTPRLSPPLTKIIPRGHTGWMRLQHVADSAMFGAIINLNPNGFSQGHNLHALSYTDASITIPLLPPACRP